MARRRSRRVADAQAQQDAVALAMLMDVGPRHNHGGNCVEGVDLKDAKGKWCPKHIGQLRGGCDDCPPCALCP
jgi:hypothetical protein